MPTSRKESLLLMAIIDICAFNGEYDLFDLRYNILKDYVDEFIVVEFDKTFSGKEKPYYFEEIFNKYLSLTTKPFIRYCKFTDEVWNKYHELALSSPNTQYGKGAEHWIREFCMKESLKDCLTHLKDDDIVFAGDCDEIWNSSYVNIKRVFSKPLKLKLLVYTYYLNNRSDEQFWGTIWSSYGYIKNSCLNHIRSNCQKSESNFDGWHFTSLKDGLRRKLEDSYTPESYATEAIMANLDKNIAENKDFLGRDFKYTVDESEWPQYLKDNRVLYKHLCK